MITAIRASRSQHLSSLKLLSFRFTGSSGSYRNYATADGLRQPVAPPGSDANPLADQDPFKRIRFLPPSEAFQDMTLPELHGALVDRYRNEGLLRIEPHLVPFWTVAYIMDQQTTTSKSRLGIPKIIRPRYTTHTGCSIAAVGPDHWCWGLILPDDIRHMTETAEMLVGTTINEDLQKYRSRGIDERTWNTENAPLFHHGYPKLDISRAKLLLDLQRGDVKVQTGLEDGGGAKDRMELHPGSEVLGYAFPSYRLAFKGFLRSGRTMYIDGAYSYPSSTHSFVISPTTTGKSCSSIALHDPKDSHGLRWRERKRDLEFSRDLEEACHYGFNSPNQSGQLADHLVTSSQDSTLNWDDLHILPIADETSAKANELSFYITKRMFGEVNAVRPLAIMPTGLVPNAPEQPKSKDTNDSTTDTSKNSKSRRPPPPPRTSAPTQHQRPPPPPSLKATLAARRSAFNEARIRATLARTAAAFKRPAFPTPTDPQGLYRILNVQLRPALLDPNLQRSIDEEVKEAYYMASKIYHPDAPTVSRSGGGSGVEGEDETDEGILDRGNRERRFSMMFQKAYDARHQLGSLEGRRVYHREYS